MFPISKKFIKLLNECDIEYTSAPADDDIDTDMINLTYFSNEVNQVKISLLFSENNDVAIRCFSLYNVPEQKLSAILFALNMLNSQYRDGKLFIDEDNDIQLASDVYFSEDLNEALDLCVNAFKCFTRIIDSVLPKITEIMRMRI